MLFAFGLGLALVAAIVTYLYATTARAGPAPETTTVDVLVASRDLEPRTALVPGDLKIVQLPRDAVPKNALHAVADGAGQVTTVSLSANEPLLATKIAVAGSGGVHIAVLPPGSQPSGSTPTFRAVSLNVPDANAAGGAIVAGDHLDVLYTLNTALVDPSKPDFVGRVIVENVPVLARTLTLYTLRIDVATAERLAALQAVGGNIQLLLRAPGDERASGSQGASFTGEARRIEGR
ncbi:MAG TPA: Flp pilus assembly protein CpaB [Candidatus Limnocylindrales bacterium]|nr:Flp pilus assembly protein CpaB [Candidatus Limnocylindrales bacterium]